MKVIGLSTFTAFLPKIWRALIRTVAAPFLLEVEKEKRKALEERVADLLLEQEELEVQLTKRRKGGRM